MRKSNWVECVELRWVELKNVQVCDATEGEERDDAGNINITLINIINQLIKKQTTKNNP